MPLTLFHTAQVHCATFDALRDRLAPQAELVHHVRSEWLSAAQGGITSCLNSEISRSVADAEAPVLCTCTTIGPVAEAAGAIRIDRPMMRQAARTAGTVMMAYCLESTKAPSLELLQSELDVAANAGPVTLLPLTHLWPLFDAGRIRDFHAGIAAAIRENLGDFPRPACVVLAQASMAGAAPLLADLPVPVLASPELAFRAGLARL